MYTFLLRQKRNKLNLGNEGTLLVLFFVAVVAKNQVIAKLR